MKKKLLALYKIGVSSVSPSSLMNSSVRISPVNSEVEICDRLFHSNLKFHVFGFGKAVFGMATALQDILKARLLKGIICAPTMIRDLPGIQTFVAGKNNLPDKDAVVATEAILEAIASIPDEDVLIILVSGGGSSLFCKPLPGLTLEEKLLTIRQLVQAGADIRELNTVRKCLSAVKGGGLAEIIGNRTTTTMCLILSDIIGDPIDLIASGPTVANTDHPSAALEVIQKHRLELKVPKNVLNVVREPRFISKIGDHICNRVIGSNGIALRSILTADESRDCRKVLVSNSVEGDVTDVAQVYLKITTAILELLTTKDSRLFITNIRKLLRGGSIVPDDRALINGALSVTEEPLVQNLILMMGGETTVKVTGSGVGGRNQQLAVLFSQLLFDARKNNEPLFSKWDVILLSAGTDGIDGPTDAAGAFGCDKLISDACLLKLDVDRYLNNNDTYTFLSAVHNGKYLIKTGHTGTNVMDLHLLSIFRKIVN